MPSPADDPEHRLEALLAAASLQLQRVFLTVIRHIESTYDLENVIRLIETGQWTQALDELVTEVRAVGHASNLHFVNAGGSAANWLADAGVFRVGFDQTNLRAIREMQNNTLSLVTRFTQAQRDATHLALTQGVQQGVNPREMARAFRQSIGLNGPQQAALGNYRRLLEQGSREALNRELRDRRFDATVDRAIRNRTPLTRDQIDRMAERYRERLLIHRSEAIARTEALRSVNGGAESLFQQAVDMGKIRADQLDRKWVSARDSRVRDTHRQLNGQVRKFGQSWTTKHGAIRYPGDPNAHASEVVHCRCTLTTRLTSLT